MLTNGNVEEVLALVKKWSGGDFLVAFVTYWMDRIIYETRWEQTYTVSIEPPRPVEKPSNIPVVDVGAGYSVSFACESRRMADLGNAVARSFADPHVRAALKSQENAVVKTQRGTASCVEHSVSSTMTTGISPTQPVHEGIEAANRPSAEAPYHQAFISPQLVSDDFRNREWSAATRARLERSEPLGYLARETLHRGDDISW